MRDTGPEMRRPYWVGSAADLAAEEDGAARTHPIGDYGDRPIKKIGDLRARTTNQIELKQGMEMKRLPALLLAATAVSLLAVAPASAAVQSPSGVTQPTVSAEALAMSDCPAASFCLWRDTGFSNTRWTYHYGSYTHNAWHYVGAAANDQASSLYNHRARMTKISKDVNVHDNYACDYAGYWNGDLPAFWFGPTGRYPQDNQISAFDMKTAPGAACNPSP